MSGATSGPGGHIWPLLGSMHLPCFLSHVYKRRDIPEKVALGTQNILYM